jgi:hypothetical protein
MQIPDTDTSEYAALIELAATGGRVRDVRVAHFAAAMARGFWRQTPQMQAGQFQQSESGAGFRCN